MAQLPALTLFELEVRNHPMPTAQEAQKCVEAVRLDPELKSASAKRAYDYVFNGSLRLVLAVARIYKDKGVDVEDLIQEGSQGLMEAIGKYDAQKHPNFGGFARVYIRNSMALAIANTGTCIRRPTSLMRKFADLNKAKLALWKRGQEETDEALAAELGVTLDVVQELLMAHVVVNPTSLDAPLPEDRTRIDFVAADDELHDAVLAENQSRRRTAIALRDLVRTSFDTEIDKDRVLLDVLIRRLDLDGKGATSRDKLAASHGVSREQIRILERRALNRLGSRGRKALEEIQGRPLPKLDDLSRKGGSSQSSPAIDEPKQSLVAGTALQNPLAGLSQAEADKRLAHLTEKQRRVVSAALGLEGQAPVSDVRALAAMLGEGYHSVYYALRKSLQKLGDSGKRSAKISPSNPLAELPAGEVAARLSTLSQSELRIATVALGLNGEPPVPEVNALKRIIGISYSNAYLTLRHALAKLSRPVGSVAPGNGLPLAAAA